MAKGVLINWTNPNSNADSILVYRSTSEIDTGALPPVHATLAGDATEYLDEAVELDETYHYLFAQTRGVQLTFADPQKIFVKPLLAGTLEVGFYGEVAADKFITGDALAARIGLTNGVSQFSDEPWLMFSHLGKTLYVAKKPLRHSISWDQINSRGAVMGTGSSVVEINGDTYKVRLLMGGEANPASVAGGEWNDLLYPIHVDDPEGRAWAQYSDADLLTHSTHGNGSYTWCQETAASSSAQRVYRGGSGVAGFITYTSSNTNTGRGWRPCLELVE